MENQSRGIFIGGIIVLLGLFFLMPNIGIKVSYSAILGICISIAVAWTFYSTYTNHRKFKFLLHLAALTAFLTLLLLINLFWVHSGNITSIIFFTVCAIVFGNIYRTNKKLVWAIVPAGIAIALVTTNLLNCLGLLRTDHEWIILFLGSGLAFYYMWIQRQELKRYKWAKIVAYLLIVIAMSIYIETTPFIGADILLPGLLILFGVYLIAQFARKRV
jgi:hypothetical protein